MIKTINKNNCQIVNQIVNQNRYWSLATNKNSTFLVCGGFEIIDIYSLENGDFNLI